jgi:6-pyruvoyltetrahydropterin/6-carboxytetrahydropterin synthase
MHGSMSDGTVQRRLVPSDRLPYSGAMYRLCFQREFPARHRLVGGDWGAENSLHGHMYKVEWELTGAQLDGHGFLVDLVDVQRALGAIIERYRDAVLNELPEFEGENPSLERFAAILWGRLSSSLPGAAASTVRLWEDSLAWAGYERHGPDGMKE